MNLLLAGTIAVFIALAGAMVWFESSKRALPQRQQQADDPDDIEQRRWVWRQAAASLGLEVVAGSLLGNIDRRPVEVVCESWSESVECIRVRVAGLPRDVTLRRPRHASDRSLLGDREFDSVVEHRGRPEHIGYLDARARALLLSIEGNIELTDGRLEVSAFGRPPTAGALIALTREAIALTCALDTGVPLPERLAHSAIADPKPAIRLRMLTVLLQHYAADLGTPAARAALEDTDANVRIFAACELNATEVLLQEIGNRGLPLKARQNALKRLVDNPDLLLQGLERAVSVPAAESLWRTAATLAINHQTPNAAPVFGRLLSSLEPGVSHDPMRSSLIDTLKRLGDSSAEPFLTPLLSIGRAKVMRAAADALACVGTVRSVPALQVALLDAGVFSGLRSPLRDAVREIQSRAAGDIGSLMIATEGGQLSVPEGGTVD